MPKTIIRIAANIPGFRRAGLAHPTGPTDYPVERFTEAQVEQLFSEPALAVAFVEVDGEPEPDDPVKSGTAAAEGSDQATDSPGEPSAVISADTDTAQPARAKQEGPEAPAAKMPAPKAQAKGAKKK